MRRLFTMRQALSDPDLLGGVLEGESWSAWRTMLIALMGEELTPEERIVFTSLTGRDREPGILVEEFWAIVGRRGGKTRAMSALATYIAGLCEYDFAPGERGVIPIMAASKQQANVAFQYIAAIFARPPFDRLKIGGTADSISLSTGVDIQVRPASSRTIRGLTAVAVIADEIAYWATDESTRNPDAEVLNAVRPALATTFGPLIVISSPHARRGELWETYRRHFGPQGDPAILVAQAPSRVFNPSLSQKVVEAAYERDPVRAAAEYGAQFRGGVEALVPSEVIEACIARGVHERPRISGVSYVAFVHPSGGSIDSFTCAVAHRGRDGTAVLDAVRERKPPFSPENVVREYAELFKSYGITKIEGDHHAGDWPRHWFAAHGITYRVADKSKSEIYNALLPLLNSKRCDLLDLPSLISQMVGLERQTPRDGRDLIDHAPSGQDDTANAVAGALVRVSSRCRLLIDCLGDESESDATWRLLQRFPFLAGMR